MAPWYDNDAFWEDTAPLVFNRERRETAPRDVEQIIPLIGLAPGSAVLDLCCGIGRHALELARRGLHVTGVDRNQSYLDAGRRTADAQNLDIDWVRADMREFRRDAAFDAAINLLTSFGYFEDPAQEQRVLANVFACLKPGGRFILDIMGREVLARIFRPSDWREERDGTLLLEQRSVRDDWNWLDLRWIIIRGDARKEHRFSLRLYAASDLRTMLMRAGFADVRVFGSLAGGPYDQTAERLVLTARKPA